MIVDANILTDPRTPGEIVAQRQQVRRHMAASRQCLAVLDDDPTGTQTIQDAPVFLRWSGTEFSRALTDAQPVLFLSTNTRALVAAEAAGVIREAAGRLATAAKTQNRSLLWASRSDSTLRGHFPVEADAVSEGAGEMFDGVLIIPAFFEGGRLTMDDIQWVRSGNQWVPAHETEFARDPHFPYRSANLRDWVAEKTRGRIRASDVRSLSVDRLRCGNTAVMAAELESLREGTPLIVNAAHYGDLDAFVSALIEAEAAGKRFIYQCAASFVKARGGFLLQPFLDFNNLLTGGPGGGLIVVGSYVEKTSRQLEALAQSRGLQPVKLKVTEVLDPDRREKETNRVVRELEIQLGARRTAVFCSSRERLPATGDRFLALGQTIMEALCEAVSRLQTRPAYVVAKGGITSMEVARRGLGASTAWVLGQAQAGVPVWRLGTDARHPEMLYVVFPGNVGDDHSLTALFDNLEQTRRNS